MRKLKFFKSIFQRNQVAKSKFSLPEEEYADIDPYVDSWVNNDIPECDDSVTQLIYQYELDEQDINQYLNYHDNSDFKSSSWELKGKLNFPGPFYTGESDTCGTGICESPNNIIFDENCMEYVMIQPRTKIELLQLWNAGNIEVFGAYYCDGNKHWTVQSVKDWWKNRNEIFEHLKNKELIKINCNQEKRYRSYLENEAEIDLKKYCYFLENGIYPKNQQIPDINLK